MATRMNRRSLSASLLIALTGCSQASPVEASVEGVIRQPGEDTVVLIRMVNPRSSPSMSSATSGLPNQAEPGLLLQLPPNSNPGSRSFLTPRSVKTWESSIALTSSLIARLNRSLIGRESATWNLPVL
jgi:hypothetical protein